MAQRHTARYKRRQVPAIWKRSANFPGPKTLARWGQQAGPTWIGWHSSRRNVFRLQTLLAGDYLEAHLLAFLQALEA